MPEYYPYRLPEDSHNPYAAPQSELYAERGELVLSPTRFEVGEILSRSWQIFKAQMGLSLGIAIGCWALNFAISYGGNMLQQLVQQAGQSQTTTIAFMLVAFVASIVFHLWIGIGQTLAYLNIARGRFTTFNDVFTGGRYIMPVVLSTLIVLGITLLIFAVGAIPVGVAYSMDPGNQQAIIAALVAGMLCAALVWCAMFVRISQYYFLILDRDAGVFESFQLSRQITEGNSPAIVGIWLMTFLITLGGFFTCVIGLLFTTPYTTLVSAVMYYALTGQPTADPTGLGVGKPAPESDFP